MAGNDPSALDDTIAGPSAGDGPVAPTEVTASDDALPATELAGRYRLLALIGVGGMGSVYRALDLELGEPVALKVLRRELVAAPHALARFRDELRLARRVTHRNVARVFDIGEHAGEKFITMELVEGTPLSTALSHGPLPLAEGLRVAREICIGVAAAHAVGVIHRDLKPDNLLLGNDGRVVITDFGIARSSAAAGPTVTSAMVGTPAYMAPEQVEASPRIDARTDVYAIGTTLYELFTGARAWPGDEPLAVAAARLVRPPPDPRTVSPTLPERLARLLVRCMARDAAGRPADAGQVLAELEAIAAPPASSAAAPRRGPAMPDERAVALAVLPLRAGAAEDEVLAEGLVDEIVDALSMTEGLRVRARGAVARYRGMQRDPGEVGRELDVQVVAEGSLRRRGEALRLDLRLTSVADGFQVWAKRFEVPSAEALRLSDEVAEAVAAALTRPMEASGHRRAVDSAAVDLYLRARAETRHFGPRATANALTFMERALERAPDDPRILAGYAIARVRSWFFAGGPIEGVAPHVERALRVSHEGGEAWLASALFAFFAGDAGRAMRDARVAVSRAPGLTEAHFLIARLLVEAGRPEDGIRRLEALRTIDPDFTPVLMELWRAFELCGQRERADLALASLPHGLEQRSLLDPIRAALWRRDASAAERLLPAVAEQPSSLWMRFGEAVLHVVLGGQPDPALVERFDREAEVGPPRRLAFMTQVMAEVLAYCGDADAVLSRVERGADSQLADLLWLERCPLFEPFRHHPRFEAARSRVLQTVAPALAAYDAPSID